MTRALSIWLPPAALALGLALSTTAHAQSLQSYAILAGSTITNAGVSTISGNIGLAPGSGTTGLEGAGANSIVLTNGTQHINDTAAIQAKDDLLTAFNMLMGQSAGQTFAGATTLGNGQTLSAGVYSFSSSLLVNGTLTLNGTADDIFIFQIGSTLDTASGANIVLTGGALASNVFWVVGSSATLGTGTQFAGQILADQSISLNTGATINCGAALAQVGAVTLLTNTINICTFSVTEPIGEDLDDDTATAGETAVLDAINAYVAAGGTLPLSFELLSLLTPEELAAVLAQLTGEAGTISTPAAVQATNSYLDQIFGRLSGSPGTVILSREGTPGPDDNTVSVMGYASEPAADHLDAFASLDSGGLPNVSQWTIWGGTYGSMSATRGDSATGAHATSTKDYGVAIGFDRHVAADTLFGFSLAAGGTNTEIDDSFGSGHSAMLEAALYARQSIEQAYVSGVISYGWHQNVTRRTVDVGGTNQYRADFASHVVAAGVEAGYDLGWFTPYAALRGQLVSTPAYSETTLAGTNVFALSYDSRLALAARSEIGARFNWTTDIENGSVSLTSGIAWVHDFSRPNVATAWFSGLGTASRFTVTGATRASDSILLSAGLGADFDNGLSLNTALKASLAANSHSYGASVRLGYSW